MSNKLKWVILLIILLGTVIGAWYYFQDDYRPKAYMAVHEVHYPYLGGPRSDVFVWEDSFILKIDLKSQEVDTFPIDVRLPSRMSLDPTGQELYVSGREGTALELDTDHNTKWTQENPPELYDLHVYNTKTGELTRIIEPPEDADGVFRGMRVSPDGKRLYTNNPYENDEDAPREEQQKSNWAIDPETGEFLFGYDRARTQRYMTEDGSKTFNFIGSPKMNIFEPGFRAFDIENDELITTYLDFDRLMEEQGGLHVNKEQAEVYIEGFEFEYPYMDGRKPLRFYDRDTFEVIGEVDLREGFNEEKIDGISHPFQITDDNQYVVFRIRMKTDTHQKYEYYIRLVDIEKMKIVDTFKVWEGFGRVIGPRVH